MRHTHELKLFKSIFERPAFAHAYIQYLHVVLYLLIVNNVDFNAAVVGKVILREKSFDRPNFKFLLS